MAHYRHGRKVPALPPPQRHAVGAATIVVVFLLVALTAWKPVIFGIPSLAVIAALGILDYAVVMTRPEPAAGHGAREAHAGLPAADHAWYAEGADDFAGPATTALPRLRIDPAASTAAVARPGVPAPGQRSPGPRPEARSRAARPGARPPAAPPRPPVAPPTEAIPAARGAAPLPAAAGRPGVRSGSRGRRRERGELHPAYERTFSPADDVLSWDETSLIGTVRPDAHDADARRDDALVQTMAVDMRGLLGGTGAGWGG